MRNKINTTFKKTCAIVLASTVIGASIPSMSIFANAAGNEQIVHTFNPVFETENGLPNSGIIMHIKGSKYLNGISGNHPLKLGIKANPCSDKDLNTQPDNYNDSALLLTAELYKYDSEKQKYVLDEIYDDKIIKNESYTSTNNYDNIIQFTYMPPADEERVLVIRPRSYYYSTQYSESSLYNPNSNMTAEEKNKYMSNKFNFSYNVFLMDTSYYHMKYYKTGDPLTILQPTTGFGDSINDVSNPKNEYDISLINSDVTPTYNKFNGYNHTTKQTDFGINIHFSEIPEDFSLSDDFFISAKCYGANGYGLGYAENGWSTITGEIPAMSMTMVIDGYDSDNRNTIYDCEAVNITSKDKEIEASYSPNNNGYYSNYNHKCNNISIIPGLMTCCNNNTTPSYYDKNNNYVNGINEELLYGSFVYSFGVKNPEEYTIKINNATTNDFTYDGIGKYTSNKSISNAYVDDMTNNIDISIIPNEQINVDVNSSVYAEKGLPNYGIIINPDVDGPTYTDVYITPKPTENHKTGNMPFIVDYYLPYDESTAGYYFTNCGRYNTFTVDENIIGKENFIFSRAHNIFEYTSVNDNNFYSGKNGTISCPIGKTTKIRVKNTIGKVNAEDNKDKTTYAGWKSDGVIPTIIGIHPINSHRPYNGPIEYDFDYHIEYAQETRTSYEYHGFDIQQIVTPGSILKDYTVDDKEYNKIGSMSTDTFNINSNNNKLDTINVYSKALTNSYNTIPKTVMQDENKNYIGSISMDSIQSGLIIKATDIIDKKTNVLPYINIDIDIKDNPRYTTTDYYDGNFYAVIGNIKDDNLYIKNTYNKEDWVNTIKTFYNNYNGQVSHDTTLNNQYLSTDYTYTLHAHIDKNDVIAIVPVNPNLNLYYNISIRNHNMYNIDMVNSNPTVSINKIVDNNIHYTGSTLYAAETYDKPQTLNITFKGITSNNKASLVSKTNNVKKVPVKLFDYDVGNIDDFNSNNQDSEFKFLFDPLTNAHETVNMWRDTAFQNIVKTELDNDRTPVFNYSIPFNNLFDNNNESVNGNTKTVYPAYMEFIYNDETKMFSYNSTLHAASYNNKNKVIEMYDSGLGLDDWGMKGAGFYPFNSFKDSASWGTEKDYNLNTALVPEKSLNYHFGMVLDSEFEVPKDGYNNENTDIIFDFIGDDDVWVFIDGHLVLDIGGIHEAIAGNINFSKGTITIGNSTRSLKAIDKNDIGIIDWNTAAWDPGTTHRISLFYLERGGTLSNCSMNLNLKLKDVFNVTYNSNGGKGNIEDNTIYEDNSIVTVKSSDGISKTDAKFVSWNTKADGTGTSYNANDTFIITENTTLYAIWQDIEKPKTYTVIYDVNGGTGSIKDDNIYTANSTAIVKSSDGISKTDAKFVSWNTKADGTGTSYNANDNIIVNNNIVLYAIWQDIEKPDPKPEIETYTVIYDVNGGTGSIKDNNIYTANSIAIVKSSDGISKTGAKFISWNTKADGTGITYNANDNIIVNNNIVLYAIWQDIEKPDPKPEIETYRVIYDLNGGIGTKVDEIEYYKNDEVTVKCDKGISKELAKFKYWNTKADGTGSIYKPFDTFIITSNVTLYAIWEDLPKPTPVIVDTPDPEPNPDDSDDPYDPKKTISTFPDYDSNSPKTGDNNMPWIWVGILTLSAGLVVLVIIMTKYKNSKENNKNTKEITDTDTKEITNTDTND